MVGNPGEKGRGDREAGKCLDRVALAQNTEGSGGEAWHREKDGSREGRCEPPTPGPTPGAPLERGGARQERASLPRGCARGAVEAAGVSEWAASVLHRETYSPESQFLL